MAKKKPYRFFLYCVARGGAGFLNFLPRKWALALARQAGRLSYHLIPRQRKQIFENLKRAFGDQKTDREMEYIGKEVLGHMLQTAVDVLRFPKLSEDWVKQHVEIGDGFSFCRKILQEGKGLLMLTPHFGNWELLAGIFGLSGFDGAVIGRRIYYEPYNRWITGLRDAVRVQTIYRHEGIWAIHEHLAKNKMIGILPDQDIDSVRGIFISFFERPAYTPVAPVKLALSNGIPMLPSFLIRLSGGKYKLILGNLIRPQIKESRDEAIRQYTQEWMQSFEKVIRQYPEQWAWMHNRWKTTPNMLEAKNKIKVEKL